MTSARDQWTSMFGATLVTHLGERFSIEADKAWKFGTYVLKIDEENGDPSVISMFLVEGPGEGRRWQNPTDAQFFDYPLEIDPYFAAINLMRWLDDRDVAKSSFG